MKIRFVLCGKIFLGPSSWRDQLTCLLRRYLGPMLGNLEIVFMDQLDTSDLLLLGADALMVCPDGDEKWWEAISEACAIGLLVFVLCENATEMERGRSLDTRVLDAKKPINEFALDIANLYRYFEERIVS